MADETTSTEEVAAPENGELSVAQLRAWLRKWVADATGQPIDAITVDRPMEEFGLASRDAIALAGDIEDLTGVTLTVTLVYQHPTIATLAQRIIDGEPEIPDDVADDSFYTEVEHGPEHDIAIVGLATRLPHAGTTPESTWEFLINSGDAITDLPDGRWSEFTADPKVAAAVREANTFAGYLDQDTVKGFDAEFFAMSPLEVERVDPQQRLMMELAWEALEHARIPASDLKGTHVGVFVGTSTNDFAYIASLGLTDVNPNDPKSAAAYALTGSSSSIVANRISYFYDFRGPSVAVDTACSSTLVAVHEAVRALRHGDASVALAGGVNMLLAPIVSLGFDSVGAFAENGRIKAFSSDADGMIRGEGAGFVVLKRLVDAERDGDTIMAVIKGTAVNSDGRSNGLLAPNPDAQADCLRQAYRDAGILPRSVDYIEAHGTGTLLGDPIEADALGRVVGRARADDQPALLGSAKTNFGHLESAAGVASLAKVLMSLQHNVLPPSINFAGPNPYIPFDKVHLKVTDETTPWPRYSGTATIGINGFGFGGTNAHVVIQEYPGPTAQRSEPAEDTAGPESVLSESTGLIVLAVSAYLPSRRRQAAAALADWIDSAAGRATPLADIGRSLARRNHGRSRAVVLATTHDEAVVGLRALVEGKSHPSLISADSPVAKGAVWVLSGFGAQHRKMAKQLYQDNAVFAAAVDEVDALIVDEAGYSVREMFLDDGLNYDVATSQVGIFTIQVGLAALLRYHGAQPEAVVGHSLGEVAAAYIAGGLCLEDAVRVICTRSRLMGEGESMLTGDDIRLMGVVEYSIEEIQAVLAHGADGGESEFADLEIAVYMSPQHTVVGGPEAQVNALVARAEAEGRMGRVLATKGAGHTSQTDALLGELAAELAGIEPTALTAGIFSTVHALGHFPAGSDPIHDVAYWVKNMRHAVWFTQAVRQAVDAGHTTFVELNANPVALVPVAATTFAAGLHNAQLVPTLKRKEDEPMGVVTALAQLYVAGHAVNLPSLFRSAGSAPVSSGHSAGSAPVSSGHSAGSAPVSSGHSAGSAPVSSGCGYADIPRTVFIRKPYWPNVRISGGGPAGMPGSHVALPDGRHVWEMQANAVTDLPSLVDSAAAQVLSEAVRGPSVAHASLPRTGALTTTLTPHLGGASVQVHAQQGATFQLLFEAVLVGRIEPVGRIESPQPDALVDEPSRVGVEPETTQQADDQQAPTIESVTEVESFDGKWDPDGGVSAEDRLAEIVAESMGYAVEDLPREIPLIELGLDSLMGMRIKNRVEYEFDIPPLQLQAVSGASLIDVGKYLQYAIENRDQVQALADQQAAERAAEAAKATADGSGAADSTGAVGVPADHSPVADAAAPGPSNVAGTTPPATGDSAASDTAPDVPPRDPAERLTFASWAVVTGESAKGIFNTLPTRTEEQAQRLAARLSERAQGEITIDDVRAAANIEELADAVRRHLEGSSLDGFVRTLRAPVPDGRSAGSAPAVPLFLFHPAGSTSLAYEPLLKRLPEGVPVYGFERVEGDLDARADEYIPVLRNLQPEGPYVLAGWSLGGILSLIVARKLREQGADVRLVGLIDTVLSAEPPQEDTHENRKARVLRFQEFARRTYNVEAELDDEQLDELAAADDEQQLQMVMQLVEFSGVKIPGGMVEHQRTSWIDNQAMFRADPSDYFYDGAAVLYLADRYHDGAIELEPRMATRAQNAGGWSETIPNIEVVHVGGDHIQIVDEPYIAKIGADLTKRLAEIPGAEPAERPEGAGAEPAQRPEGAGAEPAQRPEGAGAEPAQRPEDAGAEPAQRPSDTAAEPAQRPNSTAAE